MRVKKKKTYRLIGIYPKYATAMHGMAPAQTADWGGFKTEAAANAAITEQMLTEFELILVVPAWERP